jgi:hypothetical protein
VFAQVRDDADDRAAEVIEALRIEATDVVRFTVPPSPVNT